MFTVKANFENPSRLWSSRRVPRLHLTEVGVTVIEALRAGTVASGWGGGGEEPPSCGNLQPIRLCESAAHDHQAGSEVPRAACGLRR
jgi:hypothetical protein